MDFGIKGNELLAVSPAASRDTIKNNFENQKKEIKKREGAEL